ncbi:MAG: hypothetical protein ACI4Q5_02160 [Porcipelethomonas sp.]
MGTFYRYKCNSCGFEHEYHIGGGFLTEEYFNESERLEEGFKMDILAGKYGDILKAMAVADIKNKLAFSCSTRLFQCRECKAIKVWREKRIGLCWNKQNQYDLCVEINQCCPECGSEDFKKIFKYKPICPECKKEELELISIGHWD